LSVQTLAFFLPGQNFRISQIFKVFLIKKIPTKILTKSSFKNSAFERDFFLSLIHLQSLNEEKISHKITSNLKNTKKRFLRFQKILAGFLDLQSREFRILKILFFPS